MSYSHLKFFKIIVYFWEIVYNFLRRNREGGCPHPVLVAYRVWVPKNLSLPHGSSTYISSQEGHIPSRTPEEENDPKVCETRPGIHYRPKPIYKVATQLMKRYYPHSTTLLFLHFYVGHSTEKSMENLLGKIWNLQMTIVDPTFPLKLSQAGKGETIGSGTAHGPRLWDFRDKRMFWKN